MDDTRAALAPPSAPELSVTALPAARHSQIVDYVTENGQATVAALMARFGVSRDTVRRDLNLLEQRGLLIRSYGGAVARDNLVNPVTTLSSRMDTHPSAKQRIGRLAATLLRDGETVAINGGSTTTYLAAELAELRRLTVVTNNLRVPAALPEPSVRNIYVLGGNCVASSQVTVGSVGFANIVGISVDTAIIGITALSTGGFSVGNLEEALLTREMMAAARRTILVADHSKFGQDALALVALLSAAQILVTDAAPTGALAEALADAEVQVLVCP